MPVRPPVTIVAPGDDPPQIQGSPQLERLKPYGEVVVHTDRPRTLEERIARAKDAVCLMNTRSAVKWPAEALRALPRLRMATVCGIGTDAFDLAVARELGITICNIPGKTAPIVAEHAFGLMLALAKRALLPDRRTESGTLDRRRQRLSARQGPRHRRDRAHRRRHGPARSGHRHAGARLDVRPFPAPAPPSWACASSSSTTC